MHDVPEEFGCEGVAPDKQVFQLPDMPRDARKHAATDAAYTFVGVDLDEGLLDLESTAIDLCAAISNLVAIIAELFVDVGRLEKTILEKLTVHLHVSGEMS